MQNLKAIILVLVFVTATACNSSVQSSVTDDLPSQTPVTVKSSVLDVNALCSRVSEIKHLPYKDEPNDPVHLALLDVGEAALPCLIEKVADSTLMKDPRIIPGPTDTRVGDVAYFVFLDITKIGFTELLPAKVQKEYETKGVYAYHWFVSKRKNRLQLQAKLKEWYEQKYGARK